MQLNTSKVDKTKFPFICTSPFHRISQLKPISTKLLFLLSYLNHKTNDRHGKQPLLTDFGGFAQFLHEKEYRRILLRRVDQKSTDMNCFVGKGALERAREFLKEKADQVAAEHVPPLYFDLIGNALACDREFELTC